MRTHKQELMDYLNNSMRQLKVKLTCSAGEITSVQSLDYSTDHGNSISFGTTVSSSINVKCVTPSFSISGRELTLFFGTSDGTWTQIGIFKVLPENLENRMGFTSFTAYDRMYANTLQEYQSQLSYPAQMSAVLGEICSKCGLTAPAIAYNPTINDDVLSGYTLRDALGYIAGCQGKNAYIDCDGKLIFKWFTTCDYTADDHIANVPYADERNIVIQKVICSTGDDNIQYGNGSDGIVFNNPLMTHEQLEIIYNTVKDFTYRRLDADIPLGNYLVESGDIIKVTSSGSELSVPVMSISFHYDGGISCKLSSYGVPDSVMKSISARKFKDHTKFTGLQKEIKHVTETITGATGGYLRINFGDDGKTAELLIMDQPNAEDAVNVWRFNKNGLGHSHNGYNGPFDDVALTADGHIVADRIAGNKISGVGIETISPNSFLMMEKAELTYYTRPHSESEQSTKISGLYAMNDGGHDGLMISCLRNCWIGFGIDENGGSSEMFKFKPYDYHKFWFGGNIAVNGDVQIDGTLLIRDSSGELSNVNDRLTALEQAVATLSNFFTYEEEN
ncbi:hypothetical protein [Ruminococcus flavefaciens]|uniref:hypothetical protein n=1 Tax=Ruminococcus flavefaciens TaxID=1265 RepID=UPI0026F0698F|nr:hypothetical protein [Ruminococcus flavefaciens]